MNSKKYRARIVIILALSYSFISHSAISYKKLSEKLNNIFVQTEQQGSYEHSAKQFSDQYFTHEQIKHIESTQNKNDTILDFVAYRAFGVVKHFIIQKEYQLLFIEHLFYHLLLKLALLGDDDLLLIIHSAQYGNYPFTRTIFERDQRVIRNRFIIFITERFLLFSSDNYVKFTNYLRIILCDKYIINWLKSDLKTDDHDYAQAVIKIAQELRE
jgi:hypothetical protein